MLPKQVQVGTTLHSECHSTTGSATRCCRNSSVPVLESAQLRERRSKQPVSPQAKLFRKLSWTLQRPIGKSQNLYGLKVVEFETLMHQAETHVLEVGPSQFELPLTSSAMNHPFQCMTGEAVGR